MTKITGLDGRPAIRVERSKVTASKLKCMESANVQELLEAWAVGDVEDADVQVWLTFQLTVQVMALSVSRVVVPSVAH